MHRRYGVFTLHLDEKDSDACGEHSGRGDSNHDTCQH